MNAHPGLGTWRKKRWDTLSNDRQISRPVLKARHPAGRPGAAAGDAVPEPVQPRESLVRRIACHDRAGYCADRSAEHPVPPDLRVMKRLIHTSPIGGER